jgi:hypothetical protein
MRGQLLVDEANVIRAASLRARMLSEGAQTELVDLLRQYGDSRMELFEAGLDSQRRQGALHAKRLQDQLWDICVASR